GLKLLSYLPDDAFLAQGNAAQAAEAGKLAFVRLVLPFTAALKMEPELTRHGVFGFGQRELVSVELAPGADLKAVSALLEGAQDAGHGLLVGGSDVGGLWKLARRPDVLWVERYLPMRPLGLSGRDLGAEPV